jgi:hypothetical protein
VGDQIAVSAGLEAVEIIQQAPDKEFLEPGGQITAAGGRQIDLRQAFLPESNG